MEYYFFISRIVFILLPVFAYISIIEPESYGLKHALHSARSIKIIANNSREAEKILWQCFSIGKARRSRLAYRIKHVVDTCLFPRTKKICYSYVLLVFPLNLENNHVITKYTNNSYLMY